MTAGAPSRRPPARPTTLAAVGAKGLAEMFRSGSSPLPAPQGRYRGALLAMALAPGLDPALEALAQLWLPWLGKRFDASSGTGWNVFERRALVVQRLLPARYDRRLPEDDGSFGALPFATSHGPSAAGPPSVLRIDYDDPGNLPLVRRVLDELVEVRPGVYLGQALLRAGRRPRRLAWFTLER